MELRKLQQTGGSSFTITVPKDWVEEFDLGSKKSVVITRQNNGSLVLRPGQLGKIDQVVLIDIQGLRDREVVREIIASYLSGAEEVRIFSKESVSGQRANVRRALRFLIGFEIVSEASNQVSIRNIFDPSKFPVLENVEKMLIMAQEMFVDAAKCIESGDQELALDVIDRDTEIDRLYFAVIRQFNSVISGRISEEETRSSVVEMNYYRTVAMSIERIADHAVKMTKTFDKYNKKKIVLPSKTSLMFERLLNSLDDARKMVKSLDKSLAHKILDLGPEIEKTARESRRSGDKVSPVEVITMDSFDRIRAYLMNIAEETLDYVAMTTCG